MINFNEELHKYTNASGEEYLSVSKLLGLFSEKFDRENISKAYARKNGISQEDVLADWDKKRDDSIDHGNRIHNALEQYFKSTVIDEENEDLRPMILSVAREYSDYYRIFAEERLWNDEYKIAGTTDNRFQLTSHKKSVIDFGDYKTNLSNGIQFSNKYGKYMLGPLSHLQDCNFNKYSLQISTYAWMYQQLTGCKIGSLHIMYIPPTNYLQYTKIYVPYLKLEVEAMLKYYAENKDTL